MIDAFRTYLCMYVIAHALHRESSKGLGNLLCMCMRTYSVDDRKLNANVTFGQKSQPRRAAATSPLRIEAAETDLEVAGTGRGIHTFLPLTLQPPDVSRRRESLSNTHGSVL